MNVQAVQQLTQVTESNMALDRLITALSEEGHIKLGELLGVSKVEAGRKLKSETGLKLAELVMLFDHYGIEFTTSDDRANTVTVPTKKYEALVTLSHEKLELEDNNISFFKEQA